jgi:hypothetical protein
VGLEQGPLSLVSIVEELLVRSSSISGLENRDYGHRGSATLTTGTPLYPQKLALTVPASGSRSVGIVRSQIRPWSLLFCLLVLDINYLEHFQQILLSEFKAFKILFLFHNRLHDIFHNWKI